MNIKGLFLLLSLIICIPELFAQTYIISGEKCRIHSELLNEDREYWISLPKEYNEDAGKDRTYPVIYLLDAEKNFQILLGVQQTLVRGFHDETSPSIIVGITNTDRPRDMTPSFSAEKHHGRDIFQTSGKSENFTAFLLKELKPRIESTYRTNKQSTIIGHSLTALFVVNTLIHHTDAFDNYVALDPSLWWDQFKVYKEARELLKHKDLRNKKVFIGSSREDKEGDAKNRTYTIRDFCKTVLPETRSSGLVYDWKYYEDEGHGSMILPGMFDAFKFLYKDSTAHK
ncbi:alpha/beta hydrolase [Bacteroides reticulotermitis]|uniref:alpha/beta hydrolase n=1 Tax=Bacteroides reticulotermitis TaxID=1133319 RepID=UPI003A84960C